MFNACKHFAWSGQVMSCQGNKCESAKGWLCYLSPLSPSFFGENYSSPRNFSHVFFWDAGQAKSPAEKFSNILFHIAYFVDFLYSGAQLQICMVKIKNHVQSQVLLRVKDS